MALTLFLSVKQTRSPVRFRCLPCISDLVLGLESHCFSYKGSENICLISVTYNPNKELKLQFLLGFQIP